jgi:7,8-dihydropterin-6-yl-methyl-4-(beta-D-ribofuranosyl)aminobenzene 5'-phosphate synthase
MKYCPMMQCWMALALALSASAPMASDGFLDPASPDHAQTQQQTPRTVRSLQVKVLSTMLSGNPRAGIGEWGFAAIVEVDGQRILFDTGARPDTVLKNAKELGVDLANVKDVILSHNHPDHTSGLITLRREFAKTNPTALSRAHVGKGIFWSRPSDGRRAS